MEPWALRTWDHQQDAHLCGGETEVAVPPLFHGVWEGRQFIKELSEKSKGWGTWRAQTVECVTLDVRVMSLSSTLGVEPT